MTRKRRPSTHVAEDYEIRRARNQAYVEELAAKGRKEPEQPKPIDRRDVRHGH